MVRVHVKPHGYSDGGSGDEVGGTVQFDVHIALLIVGLTRCCH